MNDAGSLFPETEYLVLLTIRQDAAAKIRSLRQILAEKYTIAESHHADDVLLAKFTSLSAREGLLMQSLRQIVRQADPFLLFFRKLVPVPSHTFRLPATAAELPSLTKHLKSLTKVIRTEHEKPFFNQEPGITLFSKLKPFQFEAMYPELIQTEFFLQCIADEIKLLKKDKSATGPPRLLEAFRLRREGTARQTQLF